MLQPNSLESADVEVAYLRAGSLSSAIDPDSLPRMFASRRDLHAYSVVEGDLVVAEGGDVGRTEFLPALPVPTIIQNSLHRVRSSSSDIRFIRYCIEAIRSSGWLEVLCNRSTFGHLTRDKLVSLPLPDLELTEQRAVADYLDRETSRIDALIEKKRRMADLATERVDVVCEDALSLWDRVPLRRIASRIDVGIAEAATHAYADDGVPLIRSTNIRRKGLDTSDLLFIEPWFAERNRSKYIHAGDILTVRTGDAGASAVVPTDLDHSQCFTQLITTLASDQIPDLVCATLNSGDGRRYFEQMGWGSAQANISVPLLAGAPVPRIPVAEQQSVLAALVQARTWADRTSSALARQIRLLSERREALVSEAVRGELDIPGVAA